MKNKWVNVLLAALVVWAAISYCFYTQHKVTIKEYNFNKTVRVGDTRVIFKQITLNNYSSRIQYGYNKAEYPWYANIISRLPIKFQLPFYTVCSFYTRPYKINPDGNLTVKGFIISPKLYDDNESPLSQSIDIDLYYENNNKLTSLQQGWTSSLCLFSIYDDQVPLTVNRVRAVITDKETGKVKSISIRPNWVTKVYYGRPPEFPFSPLEPIGQLGMNVLNNDIYSNKVQSLVLSSARDHFPWKNLQHPYWKQARRTKISYRGTYKGYKNVYLVQLLFYDCKTDQTLANQKFYLIDQGDKFKIMDVSKVEKSKG